MRTIKGRVHEMTLRLSTCELPTKYVPFSNPDTKHHAMQRKKNKAPNMYAQPMNSSANSQPK